MTGVTRDHQIGGGIRLEREGERESSDKHLEEREGKKGERAGFIETVM